MDSRRSLALVLFLTAALAWTTRAHADPTATPAAPCSRFRAARTEWTAAGDDAARARDALKVATIATRLHFGLLAAAARHAAEQARAAETAEARAALHALLGPLPATCTLPNAG